MMAFVLASDAAGVLSQLSRRVRTGGGRSQHARSPSTSEHGLPAHHRRVGGDQLHLLGCHSPSLPARVIGYFAVQ